MATRQPTKPNEQSTVTALRCGLPYGVVMATAGAARLDGIVGWPGLAAGLLAVAILQAGWVLVAGSWRYRREFSYGWPAWLAIGPPGEHAGIHTVPLGLAVISSGLYGLSGSGRNWLLLANVCLVVAWLLTIVCVARFAASLLRRGWSLSGLDGAWFLVPAAVLGSAIAAHAGAGLVPVQTVATGLGWLSRGGALAGTVGYWAVLFCAIVRVGRHGLGHAPQAPWWIAMGCAGLAAAALGRVIVGVPALQPAPVVGLVALLWTTEVVAIVLAVPVLVMSAVFLLWHCSYRGRGVWPPTFSTAVFALGSLQAGTVLQAPLVWRVGFYAAWATLGLWLVTSGWNAACGLCRLRTRGQSRL